MSALNKVILSSSNLSTMSTELTNRINHLQSISSGYTVRNGSSDDSSEKTETHSDFPDLTSAFDIYFGRGKEEEFKKKCREVHRYMMVDAMNRTVTTDNNDLIPFRKSDYPRGFRSIMDIFQTDIYNEILTISDSLFLQAWVRQNQSGGGSGQQTITICYNTYLDKWTSNVSSAPPNEMSDLEALCDWLDIAGEDVSFSFVYEDKLGNVQKPWNDSQRLYAYHMYIRRGWDSLIKSFNMDMYEPSYIEELRNGDYSEEEAEFFNTYFNNFGNEFLLKK